MFLFLDKQTQMVFLAKLPEAYKAHNATMLGRVKMGYSKTKHEKSRKNDKSIGPQEPKLPWDSDWGPQRWCGHRGHWDLGYIFVHLVKPWCRWAWWPQGAKQ